jgi:cellulose synthase/poly-beta-1,6-N-acetylglucosamine synthase-like glycosyltransferase
MTDQPEIFGATSLAPGSPERPRVTLALFAYNQHAFVRTAVEGALAQDYDGPLEIILSDDYSPDGTFEMIQQVARGYEGPHHVRLNRNNPNMGLSAHVNRVLALAQGEIIVMAAGDDISLPARVRETVAAFARHPEAMAVSFTDIRIDDSGVRLDDSTLLGRERIINLEMFLNAGPKAQSRLELSGASRGIRREVYARFGDLRSDCPAEDCPYLLRVLYLGVLVVCPGPGIHYRVHATQMSSEKGRARQSGLSYYNQFLSDIEKMSAMQSIDKKNVQRFFRNFRTDREVMEVSINENRPNIGFVGRFILSDFYTKREKIGMIKRFMLRQKLTNTMKKQ